MFANSILFYFMSLESRTGQKKILFYIINFMFWFLSFYSLAFIDKNYAIWPYSVFNVTQENEEGRE